MSTRWIEWLNESGAVWGETLLRASLQGAALALVAWIVCRLWRRMPASVNCAVWLLVCLKMLLGLCPIAFSLPLLPAEQAALPTPLFLMPEIGSSQEVPLGNAVPYAPTLSLAGWAFVAWVVGVGLILVSIAFILFRLYRLVRRAVQFHALEPRLMLAAGPTARLIERVEWRFTSCGLSRSQPVPSSSWTASRSASCPNAHEWKRWTTSP